MKLVNKLAKYYKTCLYEEAKVSAFSNLEKKDNIVIKLSGPEVLFSKFPEVITPRDNNANLTKLMIKSKLTNNKQQLIYGYKFIKEVLTDGTILNTPLFYADCNLERVNENISVSIVPETFSINVAALVQLVSSDEQDSLLECINNIKTNDLLPLTTESMTTVESVLHNLYGELNIDNSQAVILTTINKGLAGVINDLSVIQRAPSSVIDRTSLIEVWEPNDLLEEKISEEQNNEFAVNEGPRTELNYFLPIFKLNDSQEEVVKAATVNNITSVTGAPGTGKSSTIAAIAMNYIMNGQTVLVCSKMNTAVDVVYNKLSSLSKYPFAIRTGGKEQRKELAELINNMTTNKYDVNFNYNYGEKFDKFKDLLGMREYCDNLNDLIRVKQEERNKLDARLFSGELGLFARIRASRTLKKIGKQIDGIYGELNSLIYQCDDETISANTPSALKNLICGKLANIMVDGLLRRKLMILAAALKKDELHKVSADEMVKELIRRVLPCWCVTTVDVSSSLPLIAGLFDVVIIDEASQCDIATCFPLLYRAKRAVVVGDDKQLKYLSFLPKAVNNVAIENAELNTMEYACNYRENSVFDFANFFSKGNMMLKTQYRGCWELMKFSVNKFYNGILGNKGLKVYDEPLVVEHIKGKVRGDKTVNDYEAARVIELIHEAMNDENIKSIGVLSPFRDQCKQLEKVILKEFSLAEIEKYSIVVGTAHSFQGEERDLMILSWTVADNSPIQSHTFINNPNLFNVSITRAKKKAINLVSTTEPRGLLREYLES